jgi:allene oxide cyclase
MNRSFLVAAALAVPASALVIGPAIADSPATSARATTVTVIEHALDDTTTDTGATGDSVGDILTFANPVYDAADRKQVGTNQGFCLRVVLGKSYECTWTTFLKGGQIVVQGPFYDAKGSTLAVTGGTGIYRDVRGDMKLSARNGGKEYAFAFRLTR